MGADPPAVLLQSDNRAIEVSVRPVSANQHKGFTLIELLITVVIAGILAAIAYPMYTNYVRQAHRTAAKSALLGISTREQRYYSTNNVYATSLTQLGYAATGIDVPTTGTPYYHVSFLAVSTTAFTVQAVPIGPQTQDPCGTFRLNSLGQKTSTGTATGCWQ